MSLSAMQEDFRAWLMTASPAAARRIGPDAAAGLAVYQNNYRAQLVGCLETSFPRVHEWMGDEAFLASAIAHIDSHPPHVWTLDAYADGFGKTLIARYPDNPDLHELAWIEHAMSRAFVAADAAPLPAAALEGIDWDAATLILVPSLQVSAATTNARDIWTSLSDGMPPPASEMLEAGAGLMVWRRAFGCFLHQVDAVEHDALIQVQAHGRFDALCAMLVERLGEAEGIARAGVLLASWLGNALVANIADIKNV
ncbi:HvfC/BufC N-terminal domain-containing protein [Cupriavidus basilensis]|uniref:HvfC/BufC N-terminal domain-containing protein n=1 Tax=Cupriavidus basilensis TaxID=68895 RepID=UPI0023E7B192|nr:DNA-binding domain-containing protein [Cupriavidus basilensis]MDF3884030.1 DNA-binding domain-containing protein [Cupriavidus basilensis]